MHPILTILHVGSIARPIGSYGVMLSVAMLVAGIVTTRAAVRAGLDAGSTLAALGFAVGGSIAGGYALFVCVEWIRTGSPMDAIHNGGLVFFGAPVGGGLALLFAARGLELPLGRLLDVSVPAIPVAHAMGRIGCFLGGCCFGKPWHGPWAVRYTDPIAPAAWPSVWRHPTPLYESAMLLVLAFVFAAWPLRRIGRGRRMMVYAAVYGVERIFVETFRGDTVRGVFFGGISTSQIIGVVVVGIALLALYATREDPTPRPDLAVAS